MQNMVGFRWKIGRQTLKKGIKILIFVTFSNYFVKKRFKYSF